MRPYKLSPHVQIVLLRMAAYVQVPMLQCVKHASARAIIEGGSPVRSGLWMFSRKQPRYVGWGFCGEDMGQSAQAVLAICRSLPLFPCCTDLKRGML